MRWLSEKYDGVRAYWNGTEFISRHGKIIQTPSFLKDGMPDAECLDGELWMGRRCFNRLTKLTRPTKGNSEKMNDEWKEVKYMIFDLPNCKEGIEKRIEILKTIRFPEHAQLVEKIECEGDQHLEEYLAAVIAGGGEGIMAQRPSSKYQIGRTSDIVKVKVTRSNWCCD